MRQCDVEPTVTYSGDATFGDATNRVTVDALVNGCCAAVAAHADAGCACALEVAEGLAPFDYTSARAPSAMARSDAVHAAVATLEALCFGGKGDTPNDARDAVHDELEHDAYDAATQKPTSCVASSATLAATRAPSRSRASLLGILQRFHAHRRERVRLVVVAVPGDVPGREGVRRVPAVARRRRERRRRDLRRFRAEVERK